MEVAWDVGCDKVHSGPGGIEWGVFFWGRRGGMMRGNLPKGLSDDV